MHLTFFTVFEQVTWTKSPLVHRCAESIPNRASDRLTYTAEEHALIFSALLW